MANLQEFLQTISFPCERFLPVTNFEGRFWISDHGRLVSFNWNYKLMKPWVDSTGYYACTLRMNPVKLCTRIHVLVGEHFCIKVSHPTEKMSWNHKDGNKLNNHFTNFNYITMADNCAHAKETGLCDIKGEKHGMSKLTDEKALDIYTLRRSGKTTAELSLQFNISRRQVNDIYRGVAWKHITCHLP